MEEFREAGIDRNGPFRAFGNSAPSEVKKVTENVLKAVNIEEFVESINTVSVFCYAILDNN